MEENNVGLEKELTNKRKENRFSFEDFEKAENNENFIADKEAIIIPDDNSDTSLSEKDNTEETTEGSENVSIEESAEERESVSIEEPAQGSIMDNEYDALESAENQIFTEEEKYRAFLQEAFSNPANEAMTADLEEKKEALNTELLEGKLMLEQLREEVEREEEKIAPIKDEYMKKIEEMEQQITKLELDHKIKVKNHVKRKAELNDLKKEMKNEQINQEVYQDVADALKERAAKTLFNKQKILDLYNEKQNEADDSKNKFIDMMLKIEELEDGKDEEEAAHQLEEEEFLQNKEKLEEELNQIKNELAEKTSDYMDIKCKYETDLSDFSNKENEYLEIVAKLSEFK